VNEALARWRADLIEDLGVPDNISTQQECLIELAARSKFILDSIDNWLLSQPSLVVDDDKKIISAVIQRQTLADDLARYLSQLGLECRRKEKTLTEILNSHDEQP